MNPTPQGLTLFRPLEQSGTAYYPIYDPSHNVTGLMKDNGDGTTTLVASYTYGPFGEKLAADQAFDGFTDTNPFRFSTKYTDTETGLVYFGLRYYSPTLGRFINRDPIGEQGGLNLHGYVFNNPVNRWDYIGLTPPDDDPYPDSVADVPSDGSLNGFGSDTFVGGMTGAGGWSADIYVPTISFAQAFALVGSSVQGGMTITIFGSSERPAGPGKPSSGGSTLGNLLRKNVPLLGGLIGAAGDVVSGISNVALGIGTLGQSGSLGRGFSQIGHGTTQALDIVTRDIGAAAMGVAGKIYVTTRDVLNVATFGQINSLGDMRAGASEGKTRLVDAIKRAVFNAPVFAYGNFNGSGWGVPNFGNGAEAEARRINQSDVAAYRHDQEPWSDWRWIRDQFTTNPEGQWVGPIGAVFAVYGAIPFSIRGATQSRDVRNAGK